LASGPTTLDKAEPGKAAAHPAVDQESTSLSQGRLFKPVFFCFWGANYGNTEQSPWQG
jgi:hypothetical protein